MQAKGRIMTLISMLTPMVFWVDCVADLLFFESIKALTKNTEVRKDENQQSGEF